MRNLFRDERAQGTAEYAVIAALVAVVAIGALMFFGDIIGARLEKSATAVNGSRSLDGP